MFPYLEPKVAYILVNSSILYIFVDDISESPKLACSLQLMPF